MPMDAAFAMPASQNGLRGSIEAFVGIPVLNARPVPRSPQARTDFVARYGYRLTRRAGCLVAWRAGFMRLAIGAVANIDRRISGRCDMKAGIATHPLSSFFIVAYAASWSVALPLAPQAQGVLSTHLPWTIEVPPRS